MVQAAMSRGREARESGGFQQHKLAPYAFISPFYILFAFFFMAPSLIALVLSLFRWDGINDPRFVLARNYGRLLSDKVFAQVATNTAIYAIASLLIVLPLALVLAVLLNAKSLRFSNVWRAMYFTPVVTSTVAITLVFQILYSRDTGLLNAPLIYLGLEPIYWLGDRSWVKVAIIILIAWRSTGLLTIYFLAGLQSIPEELYEAASIDGASMLQKFFSITIPMLRPIILFVSIIVLLSSIQIFDEPQILTQGGPANSSMSVVQYLYERGYTRLRLGFASAVGTVLFATVFILSLLQLQWYGVFRKED
ncbi:MAG: sugar ABC transporter permease [Chloroflexota bacterium]|nr:sugar ABC transporter permease [Chloroflexota bacterium]MDE2946905.1 sugar ABC transporter permease [Chloroflexota bacterium]